VLDANLTELTADMPKFRASAQAALEPITGGNQVAIQLFNHARQSYSRETENE